MLHLTTLAQESPAQGLPSEELVALGVILFAIGVVFLVTLLVYLIVAILLYGCLARVPQEYQRMKPGLVFLLLIPLFNLIWNFFVFLRIPESYQAYFASQGRTDVGDCGRSIGLWLSICVACSIIPCVNYISGPASLVLLIIFFVKIFGLKSQIPQATA